MEVDTSVEAALSFQNNAIRNFISSINKKLKNGEKISYNETWKAYKRLPLPFFENTYAAFTMVAHNQHGDVYMWDDQNRLAVTLEARPSFALLEQVASTLEAELSNGFDYYQFAYSAFIRSLHTLGAGSYGVVMSGRLASLATDKEMIKYLLNIYKNLSSNEVNIEDIEKLLTSLDQFPEYVIKSSEDIVNVEQEVLVGIQMREVIKKIHIFSYYYGISTCVGSVNEIELANAYLYPCHVNMESEKSTYFVYSEYIPGHPLYYGLRTMTYPQLLVTLLILHSSLAYLWKKYRFVHGDLSRDNVMLRIDPSGDPYDIPILDEDGNVKYYVRLPWHPVMIDLGMAITSEHANWTSLGTPYTTPLNDIIRLYDSILLSHLEEQEPFKYYLKMLDTVFVEEKIESKVFPTPLGLNIDGLHHSELVKIIESVPEIKLFIVEEPEYNNVIDYKPIDEENIGEVVDKVHEARMELLPQLDKLSGLVGNREDNFSKIVKNYVDVMRYSAIK